MIKQYWTIFRNIKIVKLCTGKFAIRKGWLVYAYYSDKYNQKWSKILECKTSISFNEIAKLYDKQFYDTGEIVNFIREDVDLSKGVHYPFGGYDKTKGTGYVELYKCLHCGSTGELHGYGSKYDACRDCGNNEYEDLVGKWVNDKWVIQ